MVGRPQTRCGLRNTHTWFRKPRYSLQRNIKTHVLLPTNASTHRACHDVTRSPKPKPHDLKPSKPCCLAAAKRGDTFEAATAATRLAVRLLVHRMQCRLPNSQVVVGKQIIVTSPARGLRPGCHDDAFFHVHIEICLYDLFEQVGAFHCSGLGQRNRMDKCLPFRVPRLAFGGVVLNCHEDSLFEGITLQPV